MFEYLSMAKAYFNSENFSLRRIRHANYSRNAWQHIVAVFSRARLSRLTFLKVFCLLTSLSDLKMIGVFTSKIVFH